MSADFLDEMIAEASVEDPSFPHLLKLAEIRRAARELLEALPRCVAQGMVRSALCEGVATHGEDGWGPFCDGCDYQGKVADLPYAAAVRKLREVLR